MDTHPVDPIALIAGLFFALAGVTLFADRQWEDIDVTAITAAGVMAIGGFLAAMIVLRYARASASANQPPTNDADEEA